MPKAKRVPQLKEKHKHLKPPAFEVGQTVKLGVYKRALRAVVLGYGKKEGTVIIRFMETHSKKAPKLEDAERMLVSSSKGERGQLWKKLDSGERLTEQESMRLRALNDTIYRFSRAQELAVGGHVKMTHTRSVPESKLYLIDPQKPKHQVVPKTQRRKTRRTNTIKKAGKMTPKKGARFLSAQGLPGARPDFKRRGYRSRITKAGPKSKTRHFLR